METSTSQAMAVLAAKSLLSMQLGGGFVEGMVASL
jgi:hypothetical protein